MLWYRLFIHRAIEYLGNSSRTPPTVGTIASVNESVQQAVSGRSSSVVPLSSPSVVEHGEDMSVSSRDIPIPVATASEKEENLSQAAVSDDDAESDHFEGSGSEPDAADPLPNPLPARPKKAMTENRRDRPSTVSDAATKMIKRIALRIVEKNEFNAQGRILWNEVYKAYPRLWLTDGIRLADNTIHNKVSEVIKQLRLAAAE